MKILLTSLVICSVILSLANDGAYYLSGNQLIPIQETDISIKKEILIVKRINADHVQVTVSYLFDNPTAEKNLLVGFEAASPAGDVNWRPKNGEHPYMSNFSVILNATPLKYTPSIVLDSNYYTSGQIQSASEQEILKKFANVGDPSFYYVYHFNAAFKKGLNTIQHTYNFRLSNSVEEHYAFEYILTAANRWANKGIDDFTLIIDMGEFQDFLIEKQFFTDNASWLMNGKIVDFVRGNELSYRSFPYASNFFTHYGPIVFSQKNFHPKGELNLYSIRDYNLMNVTVFDATKHQLPYNLDAVSELAKSANELSFKILRNLPYARRGFVFKTPEIQAYYEKQKWYNPIPSYISTENDLTEQEINWLTQVNANKF
jgi:hypothetical protein